MPDWAYIGLNPPGRRIFAPDGVSTLVSTYEDGRQDRREKAFNVKERWQEQFKFSHDDEAAAWAFFLSKKLTVSFTTFWRTGVDKTVYFDAVPQRHMFYEGTTGVDNERPHLWVVTFREV